MKKIKIVAILCSALITGICFYLCREMLSTRIIPVSFSIQSNISDEYIITAIYSSDENNPNKNKIETITNLKENEWKNVKIKLPFPEGKLQHFSLSIKSLKQNKYSITINELKLHKLDNFSSYSFDRIGSSSTLTKTKDKKNNEIITLSNMNKEGGFSIKENLNLKRYRDWSIYASVIFFIVIYSSSYIVIKFFLNTRILQKEHTANIGFIIALFITLFIPASKINLYATNNLNENRVLAQYKSLFSGNPLKAESHFNRNYGKDFEAWFNDRFRGREKIVSFVNDVKYKLTLNTFKNKGAYRYNDWVWGPEDWIVPKIENIKNIKETLNDIYNTWNIPIIALVYPAKSEVYCEYTLSNKCNHGSNIIFNYLKENIKNKNIKVISVLPYAIKHKKDHELIFYKDEHHMSQYGGQIVVDELIADGYLPSSNNDYHQYAIKAHCSSGEFIFDKKYCESNLKYGQYYGFLRGIPKRAIFDNKMDNEVSYVYYSFSDKYQNDVNYKNTLLNNQKDVGYTNLYNSNKNVTHFSPMQIGNSFVETLSLALSTRYDHVIRFRLNTGNPGISIYEMTNEISKDKPDVIITTIFKDTILNTPAMQ